MRVMNEALKNCLSKLHFGLNISMKLNGTLIDTSVIF